MSGNRVGFTQRIRAACLQKKGKHKFVRQKRRQNSRRSGCEKERKKKGTSVPAGRKETDLMKRPLTTEN